LRARVVPEVLDQIAPAHVQHAARGNDAAEADLLALAPVEDRREERPALTDERDVPRASHAARERRVQPPQRVHDAEAVRTDDPHAPAPRLRQHLRLEGGAGRTELLEARRDDDRGPDARVYALPDHARDRARRS